MDLCQEILNLQTKKLEKMKNCKEPYEVSVLGKNIIVLPEVFYPASDTELLIKTVKPRPGITALEPFSGTGVISIFLAQYAKKVIATDINHAAIENIKANIKKYNLEEKIKVEEIDIFPKGNQKFDLIIINPPYTDNAAKDNIEKATWDKEHTTVKRFFKEAKNYLNPNGKIYTSWANFADFDFIENQFKINNYKFKAIAELKKDIKLYRIYQLSQ